MRSPGIAPVRMAPAGMAAVFLPGTTSGSGALSAPAGQTGHPCEDGSMSYAAAPVDGWVAGRPRSRWPRRLVITLVVLLALLVLADRGGNAVAEHIAADTLQKSQHLPAPPDVSIDGVPFLTQLASGDYGHVSADVTDLPIANGALDLSRLHVDLNQVQIRNSFRHFHVNSVTAHGLIDYAELSRRLGVTVRYAGHDRIRASTAITILGHRFTPTISVMPVFVNGALSFTKSTVDGADNTVGTVMQTLGQLFDPSKLPLQNIPFDIRVNGLSVDAEGLELDLVGADVTYVRN